MEENLIIENTDEISTDETPEVSLGMNLYELNKMAYMQMPFLNAASISKAKTDIEEYFKETNAYYYMMLCKERSDYTLFNTKKKECTLIGAEMAWDVIDCLTNRCLKLLDCYKNDDGVIEIWVREDEEGAIPAAYFIFPYDDGVIEY